MLKTKGLALGNNGLQSASCESTKQNPFIPGRPVPRLVALFDFMGVPLTNHQKKKNGFNVGTAESAGS